ncbi:Aste57867_2324 [Aphanomyces stellatus]|uniref:Aste57867_2324 protein n=1 Tax=Aphanomyces stellatus TaxID=120398 RepID=A0A485K7A0_9STRA|nr:hypothetical protein As57867_002319 [Aphanomyces stellatus]VFT79526.1 Aste57867_2324 [Aphanomyces stellatus]
MIEGGHEEATQTVFVSMSDTSHPSCPTDKHRQDSTTHDSIAHRPDIDGLRALAITSVIIYHAYPELLPGGFIGVDIFFVISGYLNSSILFKEYTNSTFTFVGFYSRRIRRIVPTLVLVLGFTLTMGCLWLTAAALKKMTVTLVAGCLFGANVQLLTLGEPSNAENPHESRHSI